MDRIIIHVDMDAFFASVEMRDNKKLLNKPLIIGSLPSERGVVATCSYEARKYGIKSAMNIKDAYRLCPNGIYMHPNYEKYKYVSIQIHKIWESYTSNIESIALDEAYLDVSKNVRSIDEARFIAKTIKKRIKDEINLSCSVGLSYSKIGAKTASEEKKPNGYYEILSKSDFINLVIDREVDSLYTVGKKTKERLNNNGIYKIRDIQNNQEKVIKLLGKRGKFIVDLSFGIDDRALQSYKPENAQSISREITFQKDVYDKNLLKDILLLLSFCLEKQLKKYKFIFSGVSLKITYSNMKIITRSKSINYGYHAIEIYNEAIKLLDKLEMEKIRLIGIGVYNLSHNIFKQLSFDDLNNNKNIYIETKNELKKLNIKYNLDFLNNLDKIYNTEILYKTIEYMRKYNKT